MQQEALSCSQDSGPCAPVPLRVLGVLRFSTNCGVDFTDRRPESFFNQNREESFRPLHSAGVVFAGAVHGRGCKLARSRPSGVPRSFFSPPGAFLIFATFPPNCASAMLKRFKL